MRFDLRIPRAIRPTATWPAYVALAALLAVLAHAVYQAVLGLGMGRPIVEAIPVWEKPIADLGRGIGSFFGRWVPDRSFVTPLGVLSLKKTISYIIYEWIKLPVILFLTTFGMALSRRKVGARAFEKTLGREDWLGAVGGAVTGMFTPVCSCTVAMLYAGLVASGASRKASAAFLFASPALNEFAIAFMFAFSGIVGGLLYVGLGFAASILTAYMAPLLRIYPKDLVERAGSLACHGHWSSRGAALEEAYRDALGVLRRLLFRIMLSGALAGLLVNFNLGLIEVMRSVRHEWWGPIVGVMIGLPLDINAASTAPILAALRNVVPTGTLISVMMATTVASIPEASVLHRLIGKGATIRLAVWYALYTTLIGLLINLAGL